MKICINKIIIPVAVLILALTGIFACAKAPDKPNREELIGTMVGVFTSSGCGSGGIIEINDSEVIVVTALHVIDDWDENSYIMLPGKVKCFGQKFGCDESFDVGFISILINNESGVSKETVENLSVLRAGGDDLKPDDEIVMYDYFSDSNEVLGKIISEKDFIYELDRTCVLGSAVLNEGMSGTPFFDKNGCFKGIITAGNDEGIFAGTSANDVFKCLG